MVLERNILFIFPQKENCSPTRKAHAGRLFFQLVLPKS